MWRILALTCAISDFRTFADGDADSNVHRSAGADLAFLPAACRCEDAEGHWQRFRKLAAKIFVPEFPFRMQNRSDPVHAWISNAPCPNLVSAVHNFRGVGALSDCAPGVLLLHVACAQRLLVALQFFGAQDHLIEALQVAPFAETCLDNAPRERNWPVTMFDVRTNYVRFYRAVSYYYLGPELVPDLLWRPSRDCWTDDDCGDFEVCDHHKCTWLEGDCAGGLRCTPSDRCTTLSSPSSTECTLTLEPLCIQSGELVAYHPRSQCLPSTYPRMIKACSEMGQTLYPLRWTSEKLEEQGQDPGTVTEAFILPVTLRLKSPWHMLHSLVPAFAQVAVDGNYGLIDSRQRGSLDLLVIDQEMDKDTHIWNAILGEQDDAIGALDFLLALMSPRPYELLKQVKGPRCYDRALWGHEKMLYSGGGWTTRTHVRAFVAAAVSLVGGLLNLEPGPGRALLVERRNATSWGRWIDNFRDVQLTAGTVATKHPRLLSTVSVVDLAELAVTAQLKLAADMRVLFGAHGDGLSWAVFMEEGSALMEAVPGRRQGFQVCQEGLDKNPAGIFGGLARLAGLRHACWLNPESEIMPVAMDEVDVWQWGWRKLNLHIDLEKFEYFLVSVITLMARTRD